MAEVNAQMVKELREMTGAGMMECKKALVETDGEMDKAVDVLRTRGLAAAAKKAGRATNEGLIVAALAADLKTAALAEVNCETDFVARNEVFAGYANQVANAVLCNNPTDLEALKALSLGQQTVGDSLIEAVHIIGENIQVSRFVWRTVETGLISCYIHAGGRLGVLVRLGLGQQATAELSEVRTLAKDIAMQVAAANPGAVSRSDFSEETIQREMAIYAAQAAESGKPAEIQAKMAAGRLEKFYKETALLEQEFVKDPDRTIEQVIASVAKAVGDSIQVLGFDRFELGRY